MGPTTLLPIFKLRWLLAQPLQVRLLPNWFPSLSGIPYLKHAPYITVGQVVLAVPLVILFFAGWSRTFVSPSTDGSGEVASYALIATFLLANKSNSIFTFLFGMSYERLVPYHNMASLLAIVLSCFHGWVAFKFGGDDGEEDSGDRRHRRLSGDSPYSMLGSNTNLWRYIWDGERNWSGSLIVVCMAGLVATSFFRVFRRINFDLWLLFHFVFSVGVIVFCFLHEVTPIAIIAVWWIVDVVLRYIVAAKFRFPGTATLTKVADDIVEIRLLGSGGKCPIHFEAGQFVRIAVEELGSLQFHAFTVSSAPHEEDVLLHIKVLGNWTKKLMELSKSKKEISVLVEGPFGSHSMDLFNGRRYPIILCVAGGIGITPCRSTAREIFHQHTQNRRELEKLQVVWSVRDLELVRALPIYDGMVIGEKGKADLTEVDLYGDIEKETATEECSKLQTDVYVTKECNVCNSFFGQAIHRGRPDLKAIISDLKKEAEEKGILRVAVIACGPDALVEHVKNLCRTMSSSALHCGGVTFDFHEDVFAY